MRRRHLIAVAATALVLPVTAACSSSDTATPTTTTTSTTSTTSVSKTMAVDTPDGQVSLSLDGKLPPNWPSDFPLPNGAVAAGSGSLGGSDKTVMVGVFSTAESGEDAFTFYKTSTELSVESPSSGGVGPAFLGKLGLTGTYEGSVSVVGGGDKTLIVVVLTSPGAGSNGTVVAPGTGSTPSGTAASGSS